MDEKIEVVNTEKSTFTKQLDVTASRDWATVYRNTGNKPMYVVVTLKSVTVARVTEAYCDSSSPPTTLVCAHTLSAAGHGHLDFFVLPGYYYKVIYVGTADPDVHTWMEWT